jgi:NitT/TauT family transport system permease protein
VSQRAAHVSQRAPQVAPPAVADDLHREAVDAARSARRRRRRRDALVLNGARVAVLVVALLAWHLAALATSPLILPGPVSVATQLVSSREVIAANLWITLAEIGLGFAAGSAIGIAAGTVIAHSRRLESILRPYIATSQAVPKAALAPLFVLWLGFGLGPKVTIAAMISFFPLLENTIVGLRRIDPDALKLFASLGASPWQVFVKLRLPHSLPYILTGLKIGIVLATVGAVIAEFVTSNRGLGALIMQAQGNFDTRLMFAVIIVLTAMGVLLYETLQLVERWALRRWNLGEGEIDSRRTDT